MNRCRSWIDKFIASTCCLGLAQGTVKSFGMSIRVGIVRFLFLLVLPLFWQVHESLTAPEFLSILVANLIPLIAVSIQFSKQVVSFHPFLLIHLKLEKRFFVQSPPVCIGLCCGVGMLGSYGCLRICVFVFLRRSLAYWWVCYGVLV